MHYVRQKTNTSLLQTFVSFRSPITSPVHRPSSTPLPILGGRSPTNLYSPFYRGDQSSSKQLSPSVLNQKNTLSNEPGFPYFAPTQPSSSSSTPLFSVSEKVQPTSSEKCGNNNSDLSKNNKRENQQNINKETTPITTTIHNSNPMHTAFNNNNNNYTSQNININNITTSNTSNTMQSMSPAISSPTHQKWNCFSVSREMIEATSFQPTSQVQFYFLPVLSLKIGIFSTQSGQIDLSNCRFYV